MPALRIPFPPSRATLVLAVAGLVLAAIPAPARPPAEDAAPAWQSIITPRDRTRLKGWRQAWLDGLAQARAGGFGAAITGEGALLDPDAALNDPAIPDGVYRCRMVKLGRKEALQPAFKVMAPFACRLRHARFRALDGAQRPNGTVWSYDGARLLFLGAFSLGDEPANFPYGSDRDRDSVGVVERIGAARWRLVLPRPQWESQIDVIEILPAA